MSKYDRNDFKNNFLKTVIIRIDLVGTTPTEAKEIATSLQPDFSNNGFTRYSEKTVRNYTLYNFTNENTGMSIDISHMFVCITVNTVRYVPFEIYFKYIKDVYLAFEEKNPLLSVTRFGIRKINICGVKDKDKINQYFLKQYFDIDNLFHGMEKARSGQHYDLYSNEGKASLSTDIRNGMFCDNVVYQVSIDTDIYIQDNASDVIKNPLAVMSMNNVLFDIYVSVLTDGFLAALCCPEPFDNEEIIGVESNE